MIFHKFSTSLLNSNSILDRVFLYILYKKETYSIHQLNVIFQQSNRVWPSSSTCSRNISYIKMDTCYFTKIAQKTLKRFFFCFNFEMFCINSIEPWLRAIHSTQHILVPKYIKTWKNYLQGKKYDVLRFTMNSILGSISKIHNTYHLRFTH